MCPFWYVLQTLLWNPSLLSEAGHRIHTLPLTPERNPLWEYWTELEGILLKSLVEYSHSACDDGFKVGMSIYVLSALPDIKATGEMWLLKTYSVVTVTKKLGFDLYLSLVAPILDSNRSKAFVQRYLFPREWRSSIRNKNVVMDALQILIPKDAPSGYLNPSRPDLGIKK